MAGKVGIHLQAYVAGAAEWVANCHPPIFKTMDRSLDPLRLILEQSPETAIVVFRKYYDFGQQQAWLNSGDGAALAHEVYTHFADCIALCETQGVRVYLEDCNEMPWDPWDTAPDKQARLSAAFATHCGMMDLRPAVLSIAVGNPPGSFEERAWIWEKLYPALYAAQQAGGCLSRHAYGAPRMWEPDPQFYALRHRDDRAMWPADLQSLPEIHSESGVDGGVIGAASAAVAGYRAYITPEQYVEDLRWYGDAIAKDPYVLGSTVFTAGNQDMWGAFDITGEPAIQEFIRTQEGSMPIPTSITSNFTPVGTPGEMTAWTFTAAGIDGAANGFTGFEYPPVPGVPDTYYGGATQTETGTFTNGTWQGPVEVSVNTTPLPSEGVTGSLFLQIVELDGVSFDGGRHGPFPIQILPTGTATQPPPGPMSAEEKRALDELWGLAAAFGQNNDPTNQQYIEQRVVAIKDGHAGEALAPAEQAALDELWALAGGFRANDDPENANYIESRVVVIKNEHGLAR